MNIRMTLNNPRTDNTWDEDYSKPEIHTIEAAQQWANYLVNRFNETFNTGNTRVLLSTRELEAGEGNPRITRR